MLFSIRQVSRRSIDLEQEKKQILIIVISSDVIFPQAFRARHTFPLSSLAE